MSVLHRYTDFGSIPAPSDKDVKATEEEIEGAKLDSFEAGYQAGWDDAIKAQGEAEAKISEDFVQNLQDISFTHHEAYLKLSAGMKPVLFSIVGKLLPEIASHSVVPQIVQYLSQLMDDAACDAIEITVSPDIQPLIEQRLSQSISVPFSLATDPDLNTRQVYLRVNQTEREVNLGAVIDEAKSAIEAFFHTIEQEIEND